MKKYILALLLLSQFLFAQNFDKKWEAVITMEKEGKIKSADAIVDGIYKKAVAKKDEPEIIKTFFYKSKYMQTLEKDAQSKIIANLKAEIEKASTPSKAILNLVYAKCLSEYYNINRYRRSTVTPTNDEDSNFLTWSNTQFEKQIEVAYNKSIANETILKKTNLDQYQILFDFPSSQENRQTSLFNYILKENIIYYKSKINAYQFDSEKFASYKKELLGSTNEFATLNLDFIENTVLEKLLSYYQKLEKDIPTTKNELERIQFCNDYLLKSDDDFMKSLQYVEVRTKEPTEIQKIQFEKALIYSKKASKEFFPYYNIKTIALLDSILSVKNRSNTFKRAYQKKHEINLKTVTVKLEKYIYPNQKSRAFINYKNISKLTISYYKINSTELQQLQDYKYKKDSLALHIVGSKKKYTTQNYVLKDPKDYFEHTTEVLLPEIEQGNYLVYFQTDTNSTEIVGTTYDIVMVSNLSVLASCSDNTELYTVVNRKNGQPIPNVNLKSTAFNILTNANGEAFYKKIKNEVNYNYNHPIVLTTDKDTIQINKGYLYESETFSKHKHPEIHSGKIEFYLDRAIYRPGQTVHYKGVAFQKKGKKSSIVPNLLTKIIIEDASYNTIKEFEISTNEYGSFSGEFTLPKTGLTGDFTIEAEEPDDVEKDPYYDKIEDEHPFWDNVDFEESTIAFKVEEYKRPKFEIVLNPLTAAYSVDQKITVTGSANSFSGSTITDATVVYTITEQIIKSISTKQYGQQYGRNKIIVNSSTKTDSEGKFTIAFLPYVDHEIKKESLPIYSFRIKATITDINGETHSIETLVGNAGYHSLKLKTDIAYRIETKNKNKLTINSDNLNNTFVPTTGELRFYRLRKITNKIKPRVWPTPEFTSISDDEFERLFPFEQNQKPIDEVDLGQLVYSKTVNTANSKQIALDFMENYTSGIYKVIFTATDILNNKVETSSEFNLIQSSENQNNWQLFTVEKVNKNPKKDGFIKIKVSSLNPNLYINIVANYKNFSLFNQTTSLEKNEKIVTIPIENDFTNSIYINFTSVFENTTFTDNLEIILKEQQPKLNFEITTFRNKVEPGKSENWSFKITSTNTALASEVLASMYDKSLDQFATKNWSTLDLNEQNYYNSNRKVSMGFDKNYSVLKGLNSFLNQISFENENAQLMWFGFNFSQINNLYTLRQYQQQLGKKALKPTNAKMVYGIISDKDNVLPGVTVSIKGTERSTTSDFDGYYQIEAAPGEILVVNYIGYSQKEQLISGKTLDIQIIESENALNEVVVVGYGMVKKSNLTGAVSRVQVSDDSAHNSEGIKLALQGKIAGLSVTTDKVVIRGVSSIDSTKLPLYIIDGEIRSGDQFKSIDSSDILSIDVIKDDKMISIYGNQATYGVILITTKKGLATLSQVKTRTNLSETAFFFPHLRTDNKGTISFNFTSPEALTAWKLRLFAHNKNAVSGYMEQNVITQKELMVTPNFPRFLREKDTITITTKISNMTAQPKTGLAVLQLFDVITMQPIDSKMMNIKTTQNFSVNAMGNTTASWKIVVPVGVQAVQYKVLAKAGNYSDGEENMIPVLTNSILVTESIPVWVRENSTKEYTFENLKNNSSTTLRNHQLTLEYTSNPTWMALQSLPYLMEYEHECAEQTFARFYANAMATTIINSNPKIATLFEDWRKNGKLNSKLEVNEELKSILLAETPWLKEAKSEDEKKQQLATLFDLEKMKNSQEVIFSKLQQKQKASGGFAWFDGSDENEYITRHILAGLGHLEKLSTDAIIAESVATIAAKGIQYVDSKFIKNYNLRIKNSTESGKLNWLNTSTDLHYLYTRSFYLKAYPLRSELQKATQANIAALRKDWLNYTLYEKGMAALVLHRFGDKETAKKIITSLKETASNNEDWGMYWIANKSGWYWYQAPIETQALLIEAFTEVTNDTKAVDAMKVWLLKNKQTKNWPTTKATTEAVYALLLQGSDWLSVKDNTKITIGDQKIFTKKLAENEKEAETGYLKLNWKGDEIIKDMAKIVIENKSKVPGYGGIYWQYFEDLDNIKSNASTSLSVTKELCLKKATDKGNVLQKISTTNNLKIGDLVTVRLVVATKEDMEFVHLKDLRASCFEPIDVLSGYEYKGGLGFYKSTKDVATHFFFDKINKGTYVLEYDIRVNNKGDFSNGITTIQSMYAPEFSSHSKGIRVNVKE